MNDKKRCYRVCFRGLVSLISSPNVGAPKTGHFLSYGDVITTSDAEIVFDTDSQSVPQSTFWHENKNTLHIDSSCNSSGTSAIKKRQRVMFVSVDQILTAGLPNLAEQEVLGKSNVNESCQKTPENRLIRHNSTSCTNISNEQTLFSMNDNDNDNKLSLSFPSMELHPTEESLHDLNLSHLSAVENDESSLHAVDHHESIEIDNSRDEKVLRVETQKRGALSCLGYLMISNALLGTDFSSILVTQVAEPCLPPVLHEQGSFTYRVCSECPISALNGPAFDAPPTRTVLYPGQIIQVECKIQFPKSPLDDVDAEDDSHIMYLRLKHRRGWIPDQKISNFSRVTNKSNALVEEISMISDSRTCVSFSSSTASTLSIYSDFDVQSMLLQPTPHRSRRYRRPVPHVFSSLQKGSVYSDPNPNNEEIPRKAQEMHSDNNVGVHGILNDPMKEAVRPKVNNPVLEKEKKLHSSIVPPLKANTKIFLFRVRAPKGLKVLDNPHFQVSSLIWGQSSQSTSSPFLYVNNGQRLLPRGAIFEASSKLERVSLPDRQIAGLIKLSDESGWAMVPTVDELKLQYQQMIHRSGLMNDDGISGATGSGAVEEVGNATFVTPESPLDGSKRIFLRVLPRNGIAISCPPSPSHMNQMKQRPQSISSSSSLGKTKTSIGCFGSKYSTEICGKSTHSVAQPLLHDDKHASSRRGVFPNNPTFLLGSSVIPCGLVVEVEPWEENLTEVLKPISSDAQQSQYFVRLKAGGWIPRHMYGEPVYQRVRAPPEVRRGSFWFRVLSKNGITVRQGPSRRANTIQSEKGETFRFECGEILRVSEILTFGGALSVQREDFQHESVEIFAKLYRNPKVNNSLIHDVPLSTVVQQGEWVPVYVGNRYYIEECTEKPCIERSVDGWMYEVVCYAGAKIRRGPSLSAELTEYTLKLNEIVSVSERVIEQNRGGAIWLKLKDGRGWTSNIEEEHNGRLIMRLHSVMGERGDSCPKVMPQTIKKSTGFMSLLF